MTETIQACPECGSNNTEMPPQTMRMPMKRECNDCGELWDSKPEDVSG